MEEKTVAKILKVEGYIIFLGGKIFGMAKKKETKQVKREADESIKVFQSNDLLEAQRQAEGIDELRLFYIGLRGIIPKLADNQEKYDKEFPTTFLPAGEVVKLFGGNGAYYTKLEAVCEAQAHRIVSVKTEDGFEKKPIYAQIQYKVGKGLYITFNPLMKPYLLELADNQRGFTELVFEEIFTLRSVYSWKVLEILRQWVKRTNSLTMSLAELRERLCMPDSKYKRIVDLRRYVLDSTLKELNRETVFNLSYELLRTGRKFTHIKFMWQQKEGAYVEPLEAVAGALPGNSMLNDVEARNDGAGRPAPNASAADGLCTWQKALYQEMVQPPWKVTVRRANDLVRRFSQEHIIANIRYCQAQDIEKNPGGYLWRAIKENYAGYEAAGAIREEGNSPATKEKLSQPASVPAVAAEAGQEREDRYSSLEDALKLFASELRRQENGHIRKRLLQTLLDSEKEY